MVAVERSLQTQDSSTLSASCSAMTAQLACSICDPEFGTAQKQHMCTATCQQWFRRCQHDFFSYSPFSQHLVPCGTKQASDVCSQVSELAEDGQSFCQQAGYGVMDPDATTDGTHGCFDGKIPSSSKFASCIAPRQQQQQKIRPGSRFPLLYFMVLMSAATALVLIYRRVAFIMTRRQLRGPTSTSDKRQFPGTGRRLRD